MDQSILSGLQELWRERPETVLLVCSGFSLFVFLVVDAWRLKHKGLRR